VQCIGGSIVASATTNFTQIKAGARIVLFGLSLSLAVFVFFLFNTIYIHTRVNRKALKGDTKWKQLFWVLYADMLLLVIRSIYRVAEFAEQLNGKNTIDQSEAVFYGCDTLLMALILVLWFFFFPSRYNLDEEVNPVSPAATELA